MSITNVEKKVKENTSLRGGRSPTWQSPEFSGCTMVLPLIYGIATGCALAMTCFFYFSKIRLPASGKNSSTKSTPATRKLFPFRFSREPASVSKVKVSL